MAAYLLAEMHERLKIRGTKDELDQLAVTVNGRKLPVRRTGSGYARELLVDWNGTVDQDGLKITVSGSPGEAPPPGTVPTPAGPATAQPRDLGSRFLALAAPVCEEAGARAVLQERERQMFDAAHHCSAWRLRDGTGRANDAGEPSGSAGAPILAAIDGAGLVDCCVVVTRYFGGTKLGVGGLVRAYGEAAALALEGAPRRGGVRAVRLRVRYPYEHTAAVMRMLERVGAPGRTVRTSAS